MANIKKKPTNWDKGFMQGYVAACANMVRDHGYHADVTSVLGACMKDVDDLRAHDVDETDIEVLIETIAHLKYKRALNK